MGCAMLRKQAPRTGFEAACKLHWGGHVCVVEAGHKRTPHRCLCGIAFLDAHPFESYRDGKCWCGRADDAELHRRAA